MRHIQAFAGCVPKMEWAPGFIIAGKVRVLMVVSPTCGECLKGASEVSEQVAEINQGRTVPLYVMWVPRRGGARRMFPPPRAS